MDAMDPRLALAERNVPRYTSYPTAPHFTPDVGADCYANWLAALPPTGLLSLYIHVPYCTRLCLYCGCHTKATRRRDPIAAYAARLIEEIGLVAAHARGRVTHLHWGGGTPSILGDDLLRAVTDTLKARFDFSAQREHAIELDPRLVTPSLADTLAAIGINRASLGVQDFSDHVQEAIGRKQPFETVARAVAQLREAGIDRINLDLMYGLPRQSIDDVRRSTELAASLEPQRLALFGYAHVPWFKTQQRLISEAELAGPAERLEQALAATSVLTANGYVAVGLDHFARADDDLARAARSGTLHRNFQGYTTDAADALIGLGASAIGRLPQGFVQNAVDIGGYGRAVQGGQFATVKGAALSDDDRLRAHVIERLMCDLAVDLDAVRREMAIDATFAEELAELAPLAREGLVRLDGSHITVTDDGRPFVRLAAAAFDTYLRARRRRHSIAV
jgi:oxygen-independent coproporphyrinogen-3 oxidase